MEINTRFKPHYHVSVPAGWGNDPNGMVWYKNRGHLFFQHYPHEPKWGPMHWAHFITQDFVKWKELPIALYPDQEYEEPGGCWSGTSIEKDGKLYLMYTCARPGLQRQCIAESEDGVHFTKYPGNPVLSAEAFPDASGRDFRDPKVFFKDGWYYCMAGTKVEDHGNLVFCRSKNLVNWEYLGRLFREQEGFDPDYFRLDGTYECPDFIESNGQEIIISSPQHIPRKGYMFANVNSTAWIAGKLDYETGRFVMEQFRQMDDGFDFYAPQTLRTPSGRIIMIAWKEMWGRSYPTAEDGWVGSYTLPRELVYKDGHLFQYPVRELASYRKNEVIAVGLTLEGEVSVQGIEGKVIELDVTLNPLYSRRCGVKFFAGKEHETVIVYDPEAGTVTFDRSRSGILPTGQEEDVLTRTCSVVPMKSLRLQIFLDVSSAEVFINWGEYVITGNVYPDPDDIDVRFFSEGGKAQLVSAVKYDIIVE